METIDAKSVLRSIGISSKVVAVVLVIGAGFFIYRTILETEEIKLNIKLLKKETATP